MSTIPQSGRANNPSVWHLLRLLAALLLFLLSLLAAVPIYLSGRNKPIGHVADRFFYKTISGSKHMLRSPRAIGFDGCSLDDAERAGATHVSVRDCESGKTYTAPIADVRRYGFTVARGHGRQIALTLDHYSVDGEPPEADRRAAATNQERLDLQLGLFGGVA